MPTLSIEITKYGNRNWAVYLDGQLLAVTVYKKGALAIRATLLGFQAAAQHSQLHAV